MEFLREMLSLTLVEDLGNLKAINPKFIKALKRDEWRGETNAAGQYRSFTVGRLSRRAGRDSNIVEKPLTNAKAAAAEFENDPNILALVVFDKNTGLQYGIVAEQSPKAHKQNRTMSVVVDINALAAHGRTADAAELRTVRDFFSDKVKISNVGSDNIGSYTSDFDQGKIYNALNQLNKFAKGPNREIALKVIYADANRLPKQRERGEAKRGMIPVKLTGKDAEDFKALALSSLRSRLDKFKTEKLKSQNKNVPIDDFLDAIKKDGYLDKFLVDGYIYHYWRDNFNFNALKKGSHKTSNWDSDKSYVTYKVDDDSPEYEKVRRDFWEGRAQISAMHNDDPEAHAKEVAKLKKRLKLPPTYIKVYFDFDGGAIVPASIAFEGDS